MASSESIQSQDTKHTGEVGASTPCSEEATVDLGQAYEGLASRRCWSSSIKS